MADQDKINHKTAVFGLGSMGYGMALSLVADGHDTYGFDVVVAQTQKFAEAGGLVGALDHIAFDIDSVFVVVLNAAQTEEILFGEDGVVPKLKAGAVVCLALLLRLILQERWKPVVLITMCCILMRRFLAAL